MTFALDMLSALNSLGMELLIFGLTLGFALLIQRMSDKVSVAQRKDEIKGSRPRSRCGPIAKNETVSPPSSGDHRHAPLAKGTTPVISASARLAKAQQTQGPPDGQRSERSPAGVVDEIVDGMREQQSVKFACRALMLYEDFKYSTQQGGSTLGDAVRQARHPSLEFYGTLVHCAIRAGKYQYIQTLVQDMFDHGVPRSLVFYESTMKQLAGQKQYQLALWIYDRLAADGLEPSAVTLSCLIGFAAEVGEFTRAVAFFERLCEIAAPSIRACMTVLGVHAKRQDWTASLATLREMERLGVKIDSLALNVVLSAGVASGQLKAVADLVDEADKKRPPISDVVSYNTIVKGCAQDGDVEAVLQAMNKMKKRGLQPNAITFNTAMDGAVRAARNDVAWDLLKDMREAGLTPDKFSCSILVKGFQKSKQVNIEHARNALELLKEVDGACDMNLKSTLYNHVIEGLAGCASNSEVAALMVATKAQMRRFGVQATHRQATQGPRQEPPTRSLRFSS